jgi:hypothetical protein
LHPLSFYHPHSPSASFFRRFDGLTVNDGCAWFDLPVSPSTVANQQYPDKAQLKKTILALRAQGWSYREIAREVGLHWTRVGQILRAAENK